MHLPARHQQLNFLHSRASPDGMDVRSIRNSGFVIVSKFLSYAMATSFLTADICRFISLQSSSLPSSRPLSLGISFYGCYDRGISDPGTFQPSISKGNGLLGFLNPRMDIFQMDQPPDRPPALIGRQALHTMALGPSSRTEQWIAILPCVPS